MNQKDTVNYIIFDIDGTLTKSTAFDSKCYRKAILSHIDVCLKHDWGEYLHVTDSGILKEILESHNLLKYEDELTKKIKASFIENIHAHIKCESVEEISGAGEFIESLKSHERVCLGIATGGWVETAKLKLISAGFNISSIELSSANDAMSRVDIMRLALLKAGSEPPSEITYFGDAAWDKKACVELNWNFIQVAGHADYYQRIDDFKDQSKIMTYCGL